MATAPPWMARNPARKSRRSSRRPFRRRRSRCPRRRRCGRDHGRAGGAHRRARGGGRRNRHRGRMRRARAAAGCGNGSARGWGASRVRGESGAVRQGSGCRGHRRLRRQRQSSSRGACRPGADAPPALHAADATGSANLPSPDAAEESSMPRASPRRTRAGTGIGQGPQPVAAPPGAARTPGRRRGRANAREAPTQAAAVIRQPEDEAHVDTDTALDIGNDTEHLLQDAGHPGRPRRHGPATEPAEAGSAQAAGVAGVAPDATAREGAAIAGKGKAAPAVAQAPAGRPPGAGAGNRAEQPSLAERSAALQQLAESVEARERSRRGEPKYCRSSRNASKSCAASRTCARPNWKARSQRPAAQPELGERFKKLESAREKLAQIVKGFNETVQFNTALHAISHTGLKRQEESAAELE